MKVDKDFTQYPSHPLSVQHLLHWILKSDLTMQQKKTKFLAQGRLCPHLKTALKEIDSYISTVCQDSRIFENN